VRLLQALRNEAAKIEADLKNSSLFSHMGDRGNHRESIIQAFLRPFLPQCYGLSSGEVFSSDGEQSAQMDIVVYDDMFSPVLFKSGPHQLFPAEAVYGAIEVKSDLSSAELDRACQNSRKLKVLKRTATDMLDFTPLARLNLGPEFETGEKLPRNPYLTFTFSFHGPPAETTAVNLNERIASEPEGRFLLPDFIFVADPGYMIARVAGTPESGGLRFLGSDFTNYCYLNAGKDTLPLFFLTLNTCLGAIRLRSVDYGMLWKALLNEIRLNP